jgi:hypothetical protein
VRVAELDERSPAEVGLVLDAGEILARAQIQCCGHGVKGPEPTRPSWLILLPEIGKRIFVGVKFTCV